MGKHTKNIPYRSISQSQELIPSREKNIIKDFMIGFLFVGPIEIDSNEP